MLELADRYASEAYVVRRGGSTPSRGTMTEQTGEIFRGELISPHVSRAAIAMLGVKGEPTYRQTKPPYIDRLLKRAMTHSQAADAVGLIQQQLYCLDSLSFVKKQRILTPLEKIKIAAEAEKNSDPEVAKKYGLNRRMVARIKEDVYASFAYVFRPKNSDQPAVALTKREQKKFTILQQIYERRKRVTGILKDPEVKKSLDDLPHLKVVLRTMEKFHTLRPLLERLDVPFNQHDLKIYNYYVRSFLFSDKEIGGIYEVCRKILFANWIQQRRVKSNKADNFVEKSAQFVQSQPIPKGTALPAYSAARTMKQFINEVGVNTASLLSEDISQLAKAVVSKKLGSFTEKFADELNYSINVKRQLVSLGLLFLDNALLLRDSSQLNFENLTRNRRAMFSQAREKIRSAR